jgi:GH43 family beta-xylosidase
MASVVRISLFLAPLLTVGLSSPAQSSQETNGTYTNPVGDSLIIADPFVILHEGTYYLYGTSAGDGFLCWSSDNLVEWRPLGYAYQRAEDSWGKGSYWAPEVVRYRDKFYMVFSCSGGETGNTGLRVCLAVSDRPEGPFRDLRVPMFDYNYGCIDGHIFIDQDTIPYLFYEWVGVVGEPWNREGYFWGMIFGTRLEEDLSVPEGRQHQLCLYVDQEWEGARSMHARSCEGMTVFRHNGTCYMTYSCNHYSDPDYGIGVATAETPLGMWTKSRDNPILAKRLEIGVSGPGHNCIVQSPDGSETFMVYHTHADPDHPSGRRVLNIDRMFFDENGNLKVLGPTRTPQPMPSGTFRRQVGRGQ